MGWWPSCSCPKGPKRSPCLLLRRVVGFRVLLSYSALLATALTPSKGARALSLLRSSFVPNPGHWRRRGWPRPRVPSPLAIGALVETQLNRGCHCRCPSWSRESHRMSATEDFQAQHRPQPQHLSFSVEALPTVSEPGADPDPDSNAATDHDGDVQFGPFVIPAPSVFYRSPSGLTAAFVNLRPIVPGHVLVVPRKVAPLLQDLNDAEYDDVWRTVRVVQRLLRECYPGSEGSGAFNVAVQDGRGAGQSVPHVHVHVLPRRSGDFPRNDDVYDALQEWAPRDDLQVSREESALQVPDDDRRVDRTLDEMASEAAAYRATALQMGLS